MTTPFSLDKHGQRVPTRSCPRRPRWGRPPAARVSGLRRTRTRWRRRHASTGNAAPGNRGRRRRGGSRASLTSGVAPMYATRRWTSRRAGSLASPSGSSSGSGLYVGPRMNPISQRSPSRSDKALRHCQPISERTTFVHAVDEWCSPRFLIAIPTTASTEPPVPSVSTPPTSNMQSGEDGNGIELDIRNVPLGLCSSSLAAPFSERALYPKA